MPTPVDPIPPGFHSLTIHLVVKDAAAYLDFLKQAFDAVELTRSPGPGGKLMHSRVRIGDSLIMVADDFTEEFHLPPLATGRMPFVIHLYVPDADAQWAKALAAGCTVSFPIADQFWGDRYGNVTDPAGIVWAIASRIEELTDDQMRERGAKMMGGG